jgi:hypothetical protein
LHEILPARLKKADILAANAFREMWNSVMDDFVMHAVALHWCHCERLNNQTIHGARRDLDGPQLAGGARVSDTLSSDLDELIESIRWLDK